MKIRENSVVRYDGSLFLVEFVDELHGDCSMVRQIGVPDEYHVAYAKTADLVTVMDFADLIPCDKCVDGFCAAHHIAAHHRAPLFYAPEARVTKDGSVRLVLHRGPTIQLTRERARILYAALGHALDLTRDAQ